MSWDEPLFRTVRYSRRITANETWEMRRETNSGREGNGFNDIYHATIGIQHSAGSFVVYLYFYIYSYPFLLGAIHFKTLRKLQAST